MTKGNKLIPANNATAGKRNTDDEEINQNLVKSINDMETQLCRVHRQLYHLNFREVKEVKVWRHGQNETTTEVD